MPNILNSLAVTGSLTTGGTALFFGNYISTSGSLVVSANANITRNLNVSGSGTVSGSFVSNTITTGSLFSSGCVTVANSMLVSGSLSISGSLSARNITTASSTFGIPISGSDGKINNNWINTGSGNGLDADTLDSYDSSVFISGWVPFSGSWVYATSSTFTINGDYTSVFKKGARIKFTQTTIKYMVVSIDSTYSAPNTTVSIFGGTDYVLANAAITSPSYSYALQPLGFPTWFNYGPSWTGVTVGNASITSRYSVTNVVHFIVVFILGNTSAVTGDVNFSLPIKAVNAGMSFANLDDTGIAGYIATTAFTATNCYVRVFNASGTYATLTNLSSTIPFTWGTGDVIKAVGWYEW
jgi:hypothetical protein